MALKNDMVRLWNARLLADREGGITRFADKIKRSQSQASHIIGKNPIKRISGKLARHIESSFGVDDGWLDQARPSEWMKIQSQQWLDLLRLDMKDSGAMITDSRDDLGGQDREMLTLFGLLPQRDRDLLLSLASQMVSSLGND